MPLTGGTLLQSRYRIHTLIGQGGMGAVYLAEDTQVPGRLVAVKELIPLPGSNEHALSQARQQFQREAGVLANLSYPNLPRVTDSFSWGGNEYLVMDFVAGESLAALIQRHGRLPEAEVLRWADALLDTLAYLHSRGILHRDIKPANIILTPQGQPVLVDFGLVKLWNPSDPRTMTALRGLGTPAYTPLEQYAASPGHTDARSDLYALGATLYHLLTGCPPPDVHQRLLDQDALPLPRTLNPALTPRTEAAVLKAMAVQPPDRFQSALEMRAALAGRWSTPALEPPTEKAVRPPAKKAQTTSWLAAGLAVVVVLALVGALGMGGVWLVASPFAPASSPPARATVASPLAPTLAVVAPASTVTAPPTPTHAYPPTPQGLLLADGFDDNRRNWPQTDIARIEGGRFHLFDPRNGRAVWSAAQRFDDFTCEVDVQAVAGASRSGYGLVLRVSASARGYSYYAFLISAEGRYSLGRVVDGQWHQLIIWTADPALQPGGLTNRLRMVCQGPRLQLYANGAHLADQRDAALTAGWLGFYADAGVHAVFDNLAVYRAE